MLNISEKRNINFENFFNHARSVGVYLDKNLYVKQITDDNNGIFTNKNISANQILISLPRKFLISKNTFRNFLLEQKINYQNLTFLENYYFSLPNFEYFKKNSILFLNKEKQNKILNFFIKVSPTRKKIYDLFKSFSELNDYEKYISLIFKTRAFKFENMQYLCPIVDLINYKYGAPRALYNKDGMSFKNNEILKNTEQFFQGYENQSNIVSFFLNYNFIPDNFNTVSIPSNFFSLNIPHNKKDLIDEDNWNIKGGKFSNKKRIVFDNLVFPLDFKLELSKIFPNSSFVHKIAISILEMLKNEIKHQEVFEFIKDDGNERLINSFAKVLHINYLKIELLIENLRNQV